MKPRSLKRVLGLQWALFASALLFGLCAVSVVALYVLEDSFIDARLREAERALNGERAPLPQIEVRRLHELPSEVQPRLARMSTRDLRELRISEFRIDSNRYVHVRALAPDAQGPRFLVFEAQSELRVTSALLRAAPLLGVLLLLILLHAVWLAQRFVGRIERAAGGLLGSLEREPSADALRAAADAQPVLEFQRFGHALADSLDARLAALKREEDTLRFLAHELRTPLQSAQLAFAGLSLQRIESTAVQRLQRALQRLERASAAVLWLGESTPVAAPISPAASLRQLAEELAPLAAQRGQSFAIKMGAEPHWALPVAAVEAILGNLLLNAVQHGGPGQISAALKANGLVIENSRPDGHDSSGFGLGLELARRLLARAGWGLDLQLADGRARVHAHPLATPSAVD